MQGAFYAARLSRDHRSHKRGLSDRKSTAPTRNQSDCEPGFHINSREPTGDRTVELASAQHCEGAKGNMILVAQRLTGVALA